jgi:hypothetical protein
VEDRRVPRRRFRQGRRDPRAGQAAALARAGTTGTQKKAAEDPLAAFDGRTGAADAAP